MSTNTIRDAKKRGGFDSLIDEVNGSSVEKARSSLSNAGNSKQIDLAMDFLIRNCQWLRNSWTIRELHHMVKVKHAIFVILIKT